MLPTNPSKRLCSVSVSTKLPEMNVTPSTMASEVSASRSLWASKPLMVTLRISGAQTAHTLEDRAGRRAIQFADQFPVGQEQDPVGIRRACRVVGHHHDRLAQLV